MVKVQPKAKVRSSGTKSATTPKNRTPLPRPAPKLNFDGLTKAEVEEVLSRTLRDQRKALAIVSILLVAIVARHVFGALPRLELTDRFDSVTTQHSRPSHHPAIAALLQDGNASSVSQRWWTVRGVKSRDLRVAGAVGASVVTRARVRSPASLTIPRRYLQGGLLAQRGVRVC